MTVVEIRRERVVNLAAVEKKPPEARAALQRIRDIKLSFL